MVLITGFSQNDVEIDKIKDNLKSKIDKTLKSKPLKINGALAVNLIATVSSASNPQPFTYVATGNVNVSLFGYSLPFNFTYSNRKFAYVNPSFEFNRAAFNPKYKNWAGHFGDVSMSFSPYTLSGFQFKGAGLEYLPQKWKFQILAGRFLKAVGEDTSGRITPSYERLGTGMKCGYYGDKSKIGLSVFYAKDAKNSIQAPEKIQYSEIKPMENLSFAIELGVPIHKKITLETEFSTSILTHDLNEQKLPINQRSDLLMNLLPNKNVTTQLYHALKVGLNYAVGETGTVGLGYERVDPNYRTLGGHYFANDFENITVNTQFKGKVNTRFSTGIQRDDLANTGKSSLNRMVVSAGMNFKPVEKLDISLNYSNFQSYTFIRSPFDRINRITPFDNLDTLNYTQLSQNSGVNMSYNIKQSEKGSQMINANINFMESSNQRNQIGGEGSEFINTGLNYAWSITEKDLGLSMGFNYSLNKGQSSNVTWGPLISANKKLFKKKVTANVALSYNRNKLPETLTQVVNLNVAANMILKEKHNFNFNFTTQYRSITIQPTLINITATLGYNFSF